MRPVISLVFVALSGLGTAQVAPDVNNSVAAPEVVIQEMAVAQESITSDAPTPEPVTDAEPERAVDWRQNPNNCNLDTQYVRADNFECLNKPAGVPHKVVSTPAVTGDKAAWLAASTIDDHYHANLVITKESTWRVDVVNSIGCIGLGQSCPNGSGLANDCPDWRVNPVCQLNHFDRYVKRRYGSWAAAWQFHIVNNWY